MKVNRKIISIYGYVLINALDASHNEFYIHHERLRIPMTFAEDDVIDEEIL